MLIRLLIWLAVVVLFWSKFRRPRAPAAVRGQPGARAAGRTLAPPEAMVDCARCGVHLPASEAVRDESGRPYCGGEHRRAGPRRR
ncbi:MAG: PP0621 family protein [Burkholderiaceae bacterium]